MSTTRHIEMIAAAANLGGPKWNGAEIPTKADSPTDEKSTKPIDHAMSVPMMIEMRTAAWLDHGVAAGVQHLRGVENVGGNAGTRPLPRAA